MKRKIRDLKNRYPLFFKSLPYVLVLLAVVLFRVGDTDDCSDDTIEGKEASVDTREHYIKRGYSYYEDIATIEFPDGNSKQVPLSNLGGRSKFYFHRCVARLSRTVSYDGPI